MNNDIVISLKLMAEELNSAAGVIEGQRRVIKMLKEKLKEAQDILDSNNETEIKIPILEKKITPVKPKKPVLDEKGRDVSKVHTGKRKKAPEQYEELKELCEKSFKEGLDEKESLRVKNLRRSLTYAGYKDLPESRKGRRRVEELEKLKTFAETVPAAPEKGEPLYNCFKEVQPGKWERDGADLIFEHAKETLMDLKHEGYKAIMRPVEMGYTYEV